MKYNYQNSTIKSVSKTGEIPTNVDFITLITSESDCKKQNFPKSLKESICKTLSEKKNKVFVKLSENKNFVIAIACDEDEKLRKLGAELYKNIKNERVEKLSVKGSTVSEHQYFSLLEGLLLSSYDFDKYKKSKSQSNVTIFIEENQLSKEKVKELQILIEATSLAKTLVNEPVNYMDSLKFSEVATEMAKIYGFETEVLDKKQIEDLKMGGLLGVNKGSETPPTFNIFTYKPKNPKNKKPLVLVGKGVMFDTGGYSLKISGYMSNMKSDMGGGAGVLGAICTIAGNKLPYHVIGLVPATDNKISSNALVVDDVITAMDGTTIEVQNTDAEGRLVLCDALTYAKRYNPELVIDMATLTGASVAITGDFGIAMAGNSQKDMDDLKKCGEEVYERLIQLPFWEEFEDLLKSDIADIKNIGGKIGGATTAGKFLEHFTDYPWIHLDIAGIAFIGSAKDYRQSGGTSAPVRLIYEFVKSKC